MRIIHSTNLATIFTNLSTVQKYVFNQKRTALAQKTSMLLQSVKGQIKFFFPSFLLSFNHLTIEDYRHLQYVPNYGTV